MKKSIIRIISVILILSMTVIFPISCADAGKDSDNKSPSDTTAQINPEEVAELDEEARLYLDLPTGDYGEANFNILIPEHTSFEFISVDNGEVIDDAVYRRNLEVEENLNIKINPIAIPGYWDSKDAFLSTAKNSIMSGDNAYDMISGYAAYITQMAANNMLTSWTELKNINFDKPWWNRNIVEEMSIGGIMNFVNGDLSLTALNYLMVLFFNKQLSDDFGLDSPYDIVKAGAWTFEYMKMYTSTASFDLNGDSKFTNEDMYGYATDSSNLIANYMAVFNEPITVKDADGIPFISYFERESFIDKFIELYVFIRETPSTWIFDGEGTASNSNSKMFEKGNVLIMPEFLGNASLLRDSEVEFGIIPYPKWDEDQDKYYTTSWDAYNLFCIPATVFDNDFVGTVVENLAAGSRKVVVPAFYEVALKSKYARDVDSAEMIDIIRDGAVYNFGTVVSPASSNCGHVWRSLVENKNSNIASYISSNKKSYETAFAKYLDGYLGLS